MARRSLTVLCLVAVVLGLLSGAGPGAYARNCKNGKAANCHLNLAVAGGIDLWLDLRGGGNAITVNESATSMTFDWFGNSLYQNVPLLGPVYAALCPTGGSSATVTSRSPLGVSFFPADAVVSLCMQVEIPSLGWTLVTMSPLELVASLDDFFERPVIFVLERDVAVAQASKPDVQIGTFMAGSKVTAFPPTADLVVERLSVATQPDPAGGLSLEITWLVRNTTSDPVEVFWSIDATRGVANVGPFSRGVAVLQSTPLRIVATLEVVDRSATQEVVLNVSRATGTLGYAYDAVVFRDP